MERERERKRERKKQAAAAVCTGSDVSGGGQKKMNVGRRERSE